MLKETNRAKMDWNTITDDLLSFGLKFGGALIIYSFARFIAKDKAGEYKAMTLNNKLKCYLTIIAYTIILAVVLSGFQLVPRKVEMNKENLWKLEGWVMIIVVSVFGAYSRFSQTSQNTAKE